MSIQICVAGVGMTPFQKPGGSSYIEMGSAAIHEALADAGAEYKSVQQAFAGYVYGDSTSGQRVLYETGMTGIPIVNVNNNCSTGSTALFLARQALLSGEAECVLAFGFEQMVPGAIQQYWGDRPTPLDKFIGISKDVFGGPGVPMALRFFAGAGAEHMARYGTPLSTFAKIRAKASRHAANNPHALFRKVLSVDDVLQSEAMVPGVMTRLMACPPTCGAAAVILCTSDFARRHGLPTGVRLLAQAMTSDVPDTFDEGSMIKLVGSGLSREAARRVYEQGGVGPEDINVCELHDCFAQNELITYEALGFCRDGEGQFFVDNGQNTYGGRVVTNPSGGLLSKGHPLGATGLAQCYELTHQLRHTADRRQVPGARLALQHNIGTGSAAVVTLYGSSTQ